MTGKKDKQPEKRETVASVAKRLGVETAIPWADHVIENLDHLHRTDGDAIRTLATLIVEGKAASLFALEFARLALELDAARRRDEIG